MSLVREMCNEIQNDKQFIGDFVEFGTGSGSSVEEINQMLNGCKRIFTFDGFQGLPKTEKVIPKYSDWNAGNFYHDERSVREKLSKYPNINVFKTMMSDLKDPKEYGISKVCAVNMDLDLYEGTAAALNFIDKCEWTRLIIRFDDWGASQFQIQEEMDEHEKAAFMEFISSRNYDFFYYERYNMNVNNRQVLVKVLR